MPGREDPRIVVNESKGSGYPIKPLHGGIEMIDADEAKVKSIVAVISGAAGSLGSLWLFGANFASQGSRSS
jgi:hypothetical protein